MEGHFQTCRLVKSVDPGPNLTYHSKLSNFGKKLSNFGKKLTFSEENKKT
jgi:hypothetical protein